MSTTKLTRHSNSTTSSSLGNSLDWDSPSTVTGTVKRRPVSGSSDCDYAEEKCDSVDKQKEQCERTNVVGFMCDEKSVISGNFVRKRKPKSLKTSGIPRSGYDVGREVGGERGWNAE